MTVKHERFCDRLRIAMGNQSGRSLAIKSDMSPTVVAKYINGESTPNVERLVAISDALNVTVEWLATGRGPKTYAKQMATDARLDETPESPLPLDSQEYKTKKEAIGVATRTSKKTCDDAIEIAEYTPSEGVKEYLKTFIFFSIVGEEIDTALAARFLIALKESTAKDKSKIEIKGGGDFSF